MNIFIILSIVTFSLILFIIVTYVLAKENYINDLIIDNYSVELDISGKRINDDYFSEVENFLLDEYNRYEILEKEKNYKNHINDLVEFIEYETNFFKKRWCNIALERQKNQYVALTVNFFRNITKYKQVNYTKTSYTESVLIKTLSFDSDELNNILMKLKEINYQTTSKKYNEKNQRKLMTPKLRQQIMERDNYTCQKCGKYLKDDTTNLHIDHIIPVSKGGKTLPDNLQCLCASCNLSKKTKSDNYRK